MLHRHITDVLDAYVDNELDNSTREQVSRHLEECPDCRNEYESALNLRDFLKAGKVPDPGEEYWNEVSSLILAKTVERTPNKSTLINLEQERNNNRRANYRSLVSVAASLMIFFTSLFFGSAQNRPLTGNFTSTDKNLPSVVVSDDEATDNIIITCDEQKNLLKGIILLGSPSHIEQYGILSDLFTVR
ncbi:MAG: zf-HC2 domain-containing protein [candidate division Zixibacteria bacterium]|nr:zf-HC2 domain-containing protein [candidate division Zixibacteria bacterium]MDD5425720.1 zf-HC2 domain-containing protein [candidate division Zixibacteria bacterium]